MENSVITNRYFLKHSYLDYMFLVLPLINLVLPYRIQESLVIDMLIYKISIIYIPYILLFPIIFFSKKIDCLSVIIILQILLVLASSIYASNFIAYRFFIGSQFYIPYFIFKSINLKKINPDLLYYSILVVFLAGSIQTILIATGVLVLNTGVSTEYGIFIRRGTSFGSATANAHILVLFYGILNPLTKNNKLKTLIKVLVIFSVFLSGTRGAIYPLVMVLGIEIFTIKRKKYFLFSLIVILLYFIFIEPKIMLLGTLNERNNFLLENYDYSSGRIERWLSTFNLIKSKIFLGYGGASTPYFIDRNGMSLVASPHNMYLSILIEHGIFCLVLFIIMLLSLLNKLQNRWAKNFYLITILVFNFNLELFMRGFEYAFIFWMFYFINSNLTQMDNDNENYIFNRTLL